MVCYAGQLNQIEPLRGNSASQPTCVTTLGGLFFEGFTMKKIFISGEKYRGFFVLVDNEDYERLNKYKWHINTSDPKYFYAVRSGYPRSAIRMHREIMGAKKGELIDHINFNGLDNRKCNLRICTSHQNLVHSRHPVGKSGYIGVEKSYHTWRVCYSKNNRKINTGAYKCRAQAALIRDAEAFARDGEFAMLNIDILKEKDYECKINSVK